MNIQTLVNEVNSHAQRLRALSQATLGEMIAALRAMPSNTPVDNLRNPHSYRGYYCDLAFECCGGDMRAGELLAICEDTLGRTFEGYKGGDFTMGKNTPVWIASYGYSGKKLIGFNRIGEVITGEDD